MKVRLLLLALALCAGGMLNAQVTIFSENMGTPSGTTTIAANVFQNSGTLTFSGTADVRNTTVSTGYTGASGGGNVFVTNTSGTNFQISGINTSTYSSITLSVGHYKSTTAGNNELIIEVSPDGVTYTPLTYSRPTGAGTASWLLINPTGTIPTTANLRIRFRQTSTSTQFRIDDVTLRGINAFITTQSGPWTTGSTWVGGIAPTSAQNAIMNHAVTDNTGITRDAGTTTTINTGASLTVSNGYTNNGTTTVDGTFTVDGTNGVSINSGSTFRVNGTAVIGSGGYFNVNAPIYGNASTLTYSTNGTFGRGFEWTALGVGTIGTTPGYPNNIVLTNNTTLNYNNGTPNAKAMAGNLTINSGSSFYMDFGGGNSGGALTVAGNVVNNGNFTLGNGNGTDDLRLGGDFTNGPTGNFNGNGRAIFFTKTAGTQIVTATTPSTLTIPYVVFDSSGNRTVQLGSNIAISAPNAGTAIAFGSASDVLSLNGFTLTIGTAAIANTITGAGTFSGTTASNLSLLGTGSIGTLHFTTGSQNLNTLTLNRTSGAIGATLGTPLVMAGNVVLTSGLLNVGNNPLTLGSAAAVTGVSASNYIIADRANGTSAALRKVFTAAPVSPGFAFPIGDDTASLDGSQYSPVTIIMTSGTFAGGAYVAAAVNDIKQPNFDSANDYISRYWDISTSGITGASGFTANGTYWDADVNTPASEAAYLGNNYIGTTWSNAGSLVDATLNRTQPVPCTAGAANNVTAGLRDAEINIVNVPTTTNYLTGSTYNFGNVLIGANGTVTFTIQNLGQQNLILSAATTSPNTSPYSYTAFTAGTLAGPTGTTTFTVTFTPTAPGTFNASISIPNTDATGGENPYVINFTGVGLTPTPEINIKGATGGTNPIANGSVTADPLNNTLFAATNIGSTTAAKDYEIQNTGTAVLNLTGAPLVTLGGSNPGDFSITAMPGTNSVAIGASTIFYITFSPTASGVRTAIVSIANNDSDENPYTFLIQGTGVCTAATNIITPTSGPAGTEVTITASANNLNGATVTFNGVPAAVTQVSSTQITVVVPAGAVSGNLTTTNSQGCQATNTFTVIDNLATGCQGGNTTSELFISEVTDATTGGLTYVEIYNGTGASVNMSGYQLRTYSNGSTVSSNNLSLTGTLAANAVYLVAVGISASPSATDTCTGVANSNGQLAQISTVNGGINFVVGGNDALGLYKVSSSSVVDAFGTIGSATWADALGIGDRGATFRRKNNVTVPNATYSNSDWNITDWAGSGAGSCGTNDYSDIGTFNFLSGTPPTVTVQPVFTPSCKQTSFTVAATEGFVGGNALAYQWYEVAPGATTWTVLGNSGVYSGATTATLTISNITGLTGYQYYVQVRENGATCYTASNAVMITGVTTVTWNGTAWTPSAPTATTPAVIDGNYNTAANGSFEACSLTVNGTRTLVISPNTYVSIVNDLTVATGGTLQVQDDGSLVMIDDGGVVTNNGTTQVARTTTPFVKYDYTYWTSPVSNTTLGAAMPGWRFDYSWTFNTANYTDVTGPTGTGPADGFDDNNDTWTLAGSGATMIPAKGYAVMTPTNLPAYPTTATVTFSGRVNNGVISIPLALSANPADAGDDYNLVGNPYPSSIFADDFINLNTNTSGTLLFWTHSTPVSNTAPGPYQNNFVTSDYAMYNLSGGVASSNGGAQPTGYVASGQGFFIEAITGTNLVFNNSMRDKTYGNANFYRNSNLAVPAPQKDRVWLNLQHAIGLFSQQLICYSDAATLDIDRGYDGVVSNAGNSVSFYSFIAGDKYRIQGRPAFWTDDIVPLGLKTGLPGSYTIGIEHAEGILNDPSIPIYLEDKLLNVIHDLKQGPYVFDTPLGASDDRFQLRYTDSALGNPGQGNLEQNVLVVSSGHDVLIKSGVENLATVEIFDMVGRMVYAKKDINATEITIPVYVQEQALLVRIELTDGSRTSKKVVH